MSSVDCLIIGGGMVGATTAIALADLGLKVVLVEAKPAEPFSQEQPFDLRVSAISLGSIALLQQYQIWPQIKQWRSCEYKHLGVWEDEFAYAQFSSDEIDQPYLGHIVENRLLQLSAWQQLENRDNVELVCPAMLQSIEQDAHSITAILAERKITAKLLIGADGANSKVRQLANIGITGWDYQQSAMLINVKTESAQQDITWQQFRPTGPVAFLPMPGHHGSLVWYHQREHIKYLSSLSNTRLADEIMACFPEKLGPIEVLNKAPFSLTRRHANQYTKGRVVLLGDSAHTINPLAGQGVNLGFKDVKEFIDCINEAISEGVAFDSPQVLDTYERRRRKDNLLMMSAMDALYAGFSRDFGPLKLVRNLGLFVAHRSGLLKRKALAYACGVDRH
ncbi:FAD-dependent oxidoreductase [Thalassotalea aquiviva]|uniref:FAD-dependent oxidoreductase n=1 Tax=Thalassotalea aquiviva TaxID=3242415 RepID=UPI00352AFF7E